MATATTYRRGLKTNEETRLDICPKLTDHGGELLEADHPDHLVGAHHLTEPLQVHFAGHAGRQVAAALEWRMPADENGVPRRKTTQPHAAPGGPFNCQPILWQSSH